MGKAIEAAYAWGYLYVTGKRCFICGRRYRWHTPWAWAVCNNTPLKIELFG